MIIKKILLGSACLALGACAMSHQPAWKLCPNTGRTQQVDLPPCEPRQVEAAPVAQTRAVTTTTTATTVQHEKLLPIVHTYTLYFALNKSNIRPGEQKTLDQIVSEINQYDPAQITVTGFADTSGTKAYNQKLSARRAAMVSEALRKQGVTTEAVDEQARGETDLAVQTADGVKEPKNRRVVVDFRK